MTRSTNSRLAGFMFLFYIASVYPSVVLFDKATSGHGVAAQLASVAQHALLMRMTVVLTLFAFVNAVVLAVALYGITRDEDHELAVLALSCRIAEGVVNALSVVVPLGLLWIAMGTAGANVPDVATANALGAFLLKAGGWTTNISATCFAVGSTIYAYLFLRARSIPVLLARLGVVGSLVLVVALPLQLAGFLHGPVTSFMWIPVALFEIVLGFWLLIKGAATQGPTTNTATWGG